MSENLPIPVPADAWKAIQANPNGLDAARTLVNALGVTCNQGGGVQPVESPTIISLGDLEPHMFVVAPRGWTEMTRSDVNNLREAPAQAMVLPGSDGGEIFVGQQIGVRSDPYPGMMVVFDECQPQREGLSAVRIISVCPVIPVTLFNALDAS
jgi:hypothetical protein